MIQTLRRRVNVKILILDIKAIKVKLINVYIKRKEKRNPQNFSMYFIDSQPCIRHSRDQSEMVVFDRWLPYTVTNVWRFYLDLKFVVVLGNWSP